MKTATALETEAAIWREAEAAEREARMCESLAKAAQHCGKDVAADVQRLLARVHWGYSRRLAAMVVRRSN